MITSVYLVPYFNSYIPNSNIYFTDSQWEIKINLQKNIYNFGELIKNKLNMLFLLLLNRKIFIKIVDNISSVVIELNTVQYAAVKGEH